MAAAAVAPLDGYHSCIVVGAGLAGLYAAHQLKARYPDVLIVEAQDHIGGRVRQVRGARLGVSLCAG